MQTKLNPYLSFKDNTKEAMEFYESIFGGKLEVSYFKDMGTGVGTAEGDKVMHAMLEAANGITFMASDTPEDVPYEPGHSVSMSLSGDNEAELRGYFEKLAEGGTTSLPLEKAPWGDYFGMVADKFGVDWMVNISGGAQAEQA